MTTIRSTLTSVCGHGNERKEYGVLGTCIRGNRVLNDLKITMVLESLFRKLSGLFSLLQLGHAIYLPIPVAMHKEEHKDKNMSSILKSLGN